ncbi:serine/threonine protein kinase [Tolypothrix sp. FACHB-123]|uniref:serine/threonine-protein kinase n=1 Tax=Tolypothrix sp. FACHB-123 TaxID=2692868 RepID=UPI0016872DB7|nr:serine/threonine-protein kinase [Tolypothrix sp. FACHB-123]MBD2359390.1 serine/threonine protein kinase [Tolypothrix sp. FACHB-123]
MLQQILSGRYYIINHLGSGAFGYTYLAEDRHLPGNSLCVVKQLIPQVVNQITLRLFKTEAEVLAKLGSHAQIPQLYAYFQENQQFYLVQEFIAGNNLDDELTPGRKLNEHQVLTLLQEILEVLAFVHQQKVIHRDLKPNNIRRRQDGKIVLIDFGAVKQISYYTVNPPDQTNLTTVSIGTPGYMPSEQSQGKPKFSSDVYAVGMIGIQALTGIFPHQLLEDPRTGEIMWRNGVQVSDALADVLDKMVRYDFRQRYESASEALQAVMSLITPVTLNLSTSNPKTLDSINNLLPNLFSKSAIVKFLVGMGVISLVTAINFLKPTIINYNKPETTQSDNSSPKQSQSTPKSAPIVPVNNTPQREIIKPTSSSISTVASGQTIKTSDILINSFYFISDNAYQNASDADKEVSRLKTAGYNQALKFWIQDYPNLSGKSLFVVSPAIFNERQSCAEFLNTYSQQSSEAYCAFASKDVNASADRFYAANKVDIPAKLNTYSSENNQLSGFYFISDAAFKTSDEADRQVQKLQRQGYSQAGNFWIPNYPNLSGKSLFVVYPAQFKQRQSCANFLSNYRKKSPDAYCAFASKDRNAPADRF